MNVYRAARTRTAGSTVSGWTVTKVADVLREYEVLYMQSSRTPAAPPTSLAWGAEGSGWTKSEPSPTASLKVYRARRSRVGGGTPRGWNVGIWNELETYFVAGSLTGSLPVVPASTFGTTPRGWSRTRGTATPSNPIYSATRSRRDNVISSWDIQISLEAQWVYRQAASTPSVPASTS